MKNILVNVQYRGFSIDTNEFVTGYYFFDGFKHWIRMYEDGYYEYEINPETLGVMSGAKSDSIYGESKNLFTGDICEISVTKPRSPNYHGNNDITKHFLCVVEYDGESNRFKNYQKGRAWEAWHTKGLWALDVGGVKIIGNIHENPELLIKKELLV